MHIACTTQGREKSVDFVRADPSLQAELDTATRAALAGDPNLLEDMSRDDDGLSEDLSEEEIDGA